MKPAGFILKVHFSIFAILTSYQGGFSQRNTGAPFFEQSKSFHFWIQPSITSLSTSGATFVQPFQFVFTPGITVGYSNFINQNSSWAWEIFLCLTEKGAVVPASSGGFILPADSNSALRLKTKALLFKPGLRVYLDKSGPLRFSIRPFLSAGYLFAQKITVLETDSSFKSTLFNPLFLGAGLHLLFECKIAGQWDFQSGPFVELQMNPAYSSFAYVPKSYSIGLTAGVSLMKSKRALNDRADE